MSATMTAPRPAAGTREGEPLIAHIEGLVGRALCGAPLKGTPAPPEAERCVVCADLHHGANG
jgi:hypothetical protein